VGLSDPHPRFMNHPRSDLLFFLSFGGGFLVRTERPFFLSSARSLFPSVLFAVRISPPSISRTAPFFRTEVFALLRRGIAPDGQREASLLPFKTIFFQVWQRGFPFAFFLVVWMDPFRYPTSLAS